MFLLMNCFYPTCNYFKSSAKMFWLTVKANHLPCLPRVVPSVFDTSILHKK